MDKPEKIIIIGGATCSGKTEVSLSLSTYFPIEIVNFDSLCFYRYFDIGTAKPGKNEKGTIPHHLFDIKYPDEDYNAAAFSIDGALKIKEITQRGKIPLLTGGTGLYAKSLLHGISPIPEFDKSVYRKKAIEFVKTRGTAAAYEALMGIDPNFARNISPNDLQRIVRAYEVYEATGRPLSSYFLENPFGAARYDVLYFTLIPPRDYLKKCIIERTAKMLRAGLIEEIKGILALGYGKNLKPFNSIGYKEGIMFLEGKIKNEEELLQSIAGSSMKYAKRQATFFKKTENGIIITEMDHSGKTMFIKNKIRDFLQK